MKLEDDASDAARHAGTVTHRLLDRIARDGVNAWSADRIRRLGPMLRTLLAGEGVPASLIDATCERVAAGLTRALADPRGRWVLDHHAEARSELAVSGTIDGEVRHMAIDRTFVDDDGVRWIVDFKTSEPDSMEAERREYHAQLAGYATLLQRMGGRGLRVGLYFPMTGQWVEWDPFVED
jgi:ATP-dependent exoDNAse (exonuclease V) beta subunit